MQGNFLSDFGESDTLLLAIGKKGRCDMNKNLATILTVAMTLAAGCVTAGTWVN